MDIGVDVVDCEGEGLGEDEGEALDEGEPLGDDCIDVHGEEVNEFAEFGMLP